MDKMLSFKERKHQEELTLSKESFAKKIRRRIVSAMSLSEILSTWFFCGKVPIARGTIGSLATYPVYYIILIYSNSIHQLSLNLLYVCAILVLIGIWSIPIYQTKIKIHDHSSIVIDEVIGQLLTIAMSATSIVTISSVLENKTGMYIHHFIFIVSFFFFRLFDIAKPLGIKLVDKLMKNTLGIILDDFVAALYSALTLAATARILIMFK